MLNYVPPNLYAEGLPPQGDGVRRWVLCMVTRIGGQALVSEISALSKLAQLSPFHHMEVQ